MKAVIQPTLKGMAVGLDIAGYGDRCSGSYIVTVHGCNALRQSRVTVDVNARTDDGVLPNVCCLGKAILESERNNPSVLMARREGFSYEAAIVMKHNGLAENPKGLKRVWLACRRNLAVTLKPVAKRLQANGGDEDFQLC